MGIGSNFDVLKIWLILYKLIANNKFKTNNYDKGNKKKRKSCMCMWQG
jgi:hypothetical protein